MDHGHAIVREYFQELRTNVPDMMGVLILDRHGMLLHALLEPAPRPLLPLPTSDLLSDIERVVRVRGLPHAPLDHLMVRAERGWIVVVPMEADRVFLAITTRGALLRLTHAEMRRTMMAVEPYLVPDHHTTAQAGRWEAEPSANELTDGADAGNLLWATTQAIATRLQLGTIDGIRIQRGTTYLSVIADAHQHVWVDVAADVFELGKIVSMRTGTDI